MACRDRLSSGIKVVMRGALFDWDALPSLIGIFQCNFISGARTRTRVYANANDTK